MNNSPIIGVTPLWDAGSLQWLEDAGMIHRCYNTDATGLPMEGNAIESTFKVYITDIGLLVTMLPKRHHARKFGRLQRYCLREPDGRYAS